eukprot:gene546-819_t
MLVSVQMQTRVFVPCTPGYRAFQLITTVMAAHVDEQTRAVDSIESRFYAKGRVKNRPITLQVDGSSITFPMSLADASQKLQTLHAKARPSPFGRANLTVVDPSVRVAKELAADEFTVDFDPAGAGVLEQ